VARGLYISSGVGALYCLSTTDGKTNWSVNVKKEFQGQATMWDLSESPLVDGDLVFATPGGPEATVVALDKMTGKTVWTSIANSEPPSYCSAAIFQREGRKLLTTLTADSVIGIDAKDGTLLWSHPKVTRFGIHAVTPVIEGNMLYYTAGYGSGGDTSGA